MCADLAIPAKLAAALHDALVLSKTPFLIALHMGAARPAAAEIELDTALIDRTLGAKGVVNGGVYQVSLKRAEAITVNDAGMAVPDAMGSAEAINFQPTGDGKAAIAGDFVLTANEVNPVLRVLCENGIEVTALNNHLLNDEPRLLFMHFWANDDDRRQKRPRSTRSISRAADVRGEVYDGLQDCSCFGFCGISAEEHK